MTLLFYMNEKKFENNLKEQIIKKAHTPQLFFFKKKKAALLFNFDPLIFNLFQQ